MVDAGRPATKSRASSGKTSTRAKSGTSRSGTSSASKPRTTASSAKKSRPKTSGAKKSGSTASAAKKSPSKSSAARKKTSTAKKQGTAKSGATTTVQRPAARTSTARAAGNGVNVPLPVLTPHLKTVHVPTPGMTYVEDAGRIVAAYLPPPGRLAFYGGLGIAAVAGVLDWPVAAAIGVGTVVARRAAGRGGARPRSRA